MISSGDQDALRPQQRVRLRHLLDAILPANRFYAAKLAGCDLAHFPSLPFTTKEELLADQAAFPPYGTNLTYGLSRYRRLHQTSGTSGNPLCWLDTNESWAAMLHCWDQLYDLAGLVEQDRLFFPFTFGPFLGFWTAFEAATRRGFFCLPGGGATSVARLRLLLTHEITVVLCTPTYALHLAEVAEREKLDLSTSPVRALIVAGEPGACQEATRLRIEQAWGARLFDHAGMTEVGPTAGECVPNPMGMHILEDDYIAEVIDPESGQSLPDGSLGELVLTNLGRVGSPLLRYRTGDLVRLDTTPCPCGSPFRRLGGGLMGRRDDMIHLRGNNVYPTALDALLRSFPEVAEYRIEVNQRQVLAQLQVEIEPVPSADPRELLARLDQAFRETFLFRAEFVAVPPGNLPRFEMKAKRFIKRL